MEINNNPDVYISYHEQTSLHVVESIVHKLEENNIKCWYTTRNAKSGTGDNRLIALTNCKAFIMILNKESSEGFDNLNELNIFFERIRKREEVHLFVFCTSFDGISNEAKYYLGRYHWEDGTIPPLNLRIEEFTNKISNILKGTFNFEKLSKSEGGYCFISHSHKDIIKVRGIRNQLENNGFEPLLFYLKCLTDNDEIEGLIKREIDAREWFIYIESPNSKKSKWVQKERDYIDSLKNKKILKVNIESDKTAEEITTKIMQSLRVYFSYDINENQELINSLKSELIRRDLKVFTQNEITNYNEFLKMSTENGCLLRFISKNSLKNEDEQYKEINYLMKETNKNVIPVLVGIQINDKENTRLYNLLKDKSYISISENVSYSEINRACDTIERYLLSKFKEE